MLALHVVFIKQVLKGRDAPIGSLQSLIALRLYFFDWRFLCYLGFGTIPGIIFCVGLGIFKGSVGAIGMLLDMSLP
jgi:hypothetical protein